MCTTASIWSKVGRVVYGAEAPTLTPCTSEARGADTLYFITEVYQEDIEIVGGCLLDECAARYYGPDVERPESEQAN